MTWSGTSAWRQRAGSYDTDLTGRNEVANRTAVLWRGGFVCIGIAQRGLWQTHAVERPSLQIINRMSHYLHCLSMQPSFTQISANHHPKHWAFTDWNWNLMERYQEAWKYLIYPSNVHLFLEFIHDLIMHRAGWYDILCCHNRRDNRRLYIYIYTYLRSIAWCSFSFLFWPDKKSVFIQIRWIY